MQEFSTVTASSYDAEALAPLLNEKANEGWDVVNIVAVGTSVVAYLRRETDSPAPVADTAPTETAPATEEPAALAADVAPAATAGVGEAASANDAAPAEDAPPTTPATEPEPTPEPEAAPASEPVEADPEPEPTPEPEPAAPTPAVPAGWYADPSGRYELRYWDGTEWTEHVSRAGQQYTDEPVA